MGKESGRMKALVLAEKPSVARDIARVLGCHKQINGAIEGDRYVVSWGWATWWSWRIRRPMTPSIRSGEWRLSP